MKTKIINLFAGPGAGKSTLAAGLFYHLKMRGFNVELALEYAKDLTWEERFNTLQVQPYVFGKQYHRLIRLIGKVDAIITDSPLLLGLVYGENQPQEFKDSVKRLFLDMENVNFIVRRQKVYNPAGRNQNEVGAKLIDDTIVNLLIENNIHATIIPGTEEGLDFLVEQVSTCLTNSA
jgi:hypothetical protein